MIGKTETRIYAIVGLVITLLACVAAWIVVPPALAPYMQRKATFTATSQYTSTAFPSDASPVIPSTETIIPPTQDLIDTPLPTDTRTVPTETSTVTSTQTPSVILPFKDDFSNGINPPWSMYFGKWITTDNGATITITQSDNYTGALVINEPTLTNYRLKVDVFSPNVLSANQGNLGVVVRYDENRDQNLIYYMNSASRFVWGYIPSLGELPFNLPWVTGNVQAIIISRFTLEIDVSGNTFVAKVNGAKYDQFTMPGYETGGIALVTKCGAIGSCPAFSNFSLEPK